MWFGTRGSEVQILSPRPFVRFGPFEDHVEGLSICRIKTYAIYTAVQKYLFEQSALFCRILRKILKIRGVREF